MLNVTKTVIINWQIYVFNNNSIFQITLFSKHYIQPLSLPRLVTYSAYKDQNILSN